MAPFLAALASTAAATATPSVAVPTVQAQAVVRIIRVEPVRFSEIEIRRPEMLRDTRITEPDGTARPARLLEFE